MSAPDRETERLRSFVHQEVQVLLSRLNEVEAQLVEAKRRVVILERMVGVEPD